MKEEFFVPESYTIASKASFSHTKNTLYANEGLGLIDNPAHQESLYQLARFSIANYGQNERQNQIAHYYDHVLARKNPELPSNRSSRMVPQTYPDFLEGLSSEEKRIIGIKAGVLDRYDEFRDQLSDMLSTPLHFATAPLDFEKQFIGNGKNSIVFKIEHDNEPYAVRFPLVDILPNVEALLHGGAIAKAHRVPDFEEIVAASIGDAVIISRFVPGKYLNEYPDDTIADVPVEHYENLLRSVIMATDHGVECDLDTTKNILYEPGDATEDNGFTVLDYGYQGLWMRNDEDEYSPRGLVKKIGKLFFGSKPKNRAEAISPAVRRKAYHTFKTAKDHILEEYEDASGDIPPIHY